MLSVHLWKELREQRLMVLSTVGCMLLIAVAYGLAAPTKYVPTDVASWFVVLGLSVGLVAIAGDVVPGEVRRAQFGFLLRTPGALRSAWWAKLIVVFAGLGVLGGAGFVCGELCVWLSASVATERFEDFDSFGPRSTVIAWIAIVVAVAAPWVFAVSCWTPRASSVLPVTIMFAGILFAPALYVIATYGVSVDRNSTVCGAALLLIGGLLASRLSFVNGLRFGSNSLALVRGMPAALLFLLPCWGWTAERVHTFHDATAHSEGLRITSAFVDASGTKAYLNLHRRWSRDLFYGVQLDLSSGRFSQVGHSQLQFTDIGALRGRWSSHSATAKPLLLKAQCDVTGKNLLSLAVIDARDGKTLGACEDWSEPTELQGVLDDAESISRFHLPDAVTAWVENGLVVYEDARGTRTSAEPWPNRRATGFVAGHGIRLRAGEVFCLSRRRRIPIPAEWYVVYARAADWVVQTRSPRPGVQRRIDFLNPDTGGFSHIELTSHERLVGMAGDESLLLLSGGGLAKLDPEHGRRIPIMVDGADGERIRSLGASYPTAAPAGVFRIWFESDRSRHHTFARLIGDRLVCSARADSVELVAVLDNRELVVIRDETSLERWRFGDSAVEILYSL